MKQLIKKIINWEHFYYILFLIVLVSLIGAPLFDLNNSKRTGDWRNGDTPGYEFIKQIIIENHSWPLWDHFTFSGRPMFGFGMPLLYLPALFLSLFFSPSGVLNLMLILHMLLGAIGMYFLAYELLKDKRSSLISSAIYAFSPYLMASLRHPFWVYGISFIPIELFIAIKAFKSKKFIDYSILLGIIGALHFLSSGVLQWYYAVLFVLSYLVFKIFGNNWKAKAIKSLIIIFIFALTMFPLIAIRFIPGNEFTELTNRGTGLPIEEILRVGHLELNGVIDTFVYPIDPTSKAGGHAYGQIGLVGLILMVFGLYYYFKNKYYKTREKDIIIFMILVMIGISIFSTGIFLQYIYNLPGISAQRGLDRSLIIFVLCGALLAGFGLNFLFEKLSQKNYSQKKITKTFLFILAGVLISLFIVNLPKLQLQLSEFEDYSITAQNPIFLKIAEDKDIFRFHVIEVVGIDWNDFLGSSVPNKLESVYGTYGGGWEYEYFNKFLSATFMSPAKLWGMLNVKYLISSQETNNTDYELVQKFDNIPEGAISGDSYNQTAYLYRNNMFLPRAFVATNSILVIGQKDYANNLMYATIINDNFDPSKDIILLGKETINKYGISELGKYDAILLTQGSIDQNSGFLLNKYKENGGIIVPDVIEGKNSIGDQDISDLFVKINNKPTINSTEQITSYYDKTPSFMKINVENQQDSFLFLSEKYTLFPGWTAKVDGKETEIFTSNGVLSAIFLPKGSEEVTFRYYPNSFRNGLIITSLAIIIIITYFVYPWVAKKVKKKILT